MWSQDGGFRTRRGIRPALTAFLLPAWTTVSSLTPHPSEKADTRETQPVFLFQGAI